MADAAAERERMETSVATLEQDKKELEDCNARIISENRALLDRLEDLNSQASDSEDHIKSLTATLQSTGEELQRLAVLAGRASDLEVQLAEFEIDQAKTRSDLATSKEDHQSAIQRWKKAEGTIMLLQDQIDRIEVEAKQERSRHVEIVGRMERRNAVEKELQRAAGRLKGAAATKSMDQGSNTTVVSHFVRDILKDNANLQMGLVQLREMLVDSNTEVESLREQLLLHQPLDSESLRQGSLHTELDAVEPEEEFPATEKLPALHVHHHYHRTERAIRKPKKKRPSLTNSHFTPSVSGASTPRNGQEETPLSSSTAVLSQTLATIPRSKRISTQSIQSNSTYTLSTAPSSPRRPCSISSTVSWTLRDLQLLDPALRRRLPRSQWSRCCYGQQLVAASRRRLFDIPTPVC